MGIENLKRWHWIVLSIPLGFLCAWIQLQVGPQGMQVQYLTMGSDKFEAHALLQARRGGKSAPMVDARVYPLEDGKLLVTALLPADSPKRNANGEWEDKLATHQIIREVPYFPLTALPDPPHVQVKFAVGDRTPGMRAGDVKLDGWIKGERGFSDPSPEGATVDFALRKAACELSMVLDNRSAKLGGELKLVLNDKSLPAMTQDPKTEAWHVAIPGDALREGRQVLKVTREGTPIWIGNIQFTNPAYSIFDFLNDAEKQNKDLQFSYRGSWNPATAYRNWVIGSVVIVGGIWPTIMRFLVGAGFGRPPKEPEYDLDRFKGEPNTGSASKPTAADDEKVQKAADELERKLLASAKPREPAPVNEETKPIETPVPKLESATLHPSPTEATPTTRKQYGGDYYPVVRKVERIDPPDSSK